MRFCYTFVLMSWLFTMGIARAADTQVIDQITILQKQILNLQQELLALKAIINKSPDGSTLFNVQQNKKEVIVGNSSSSISGSASQKINGDNLEALGGNLSIIVDKNKTESIGLNLTQKVQGDSFQSSSNLGIESGKRTIISAGDQLILRSGNASITLSKNGEISIIGTTIDVKGSTDVVIKGSKIQNN